MITHPPSSPQCPKPTEDAVNGKVRSTYSPKAIDPETLVKLWAHRLFLNYLDLYRGQSEAYKAGANYRRRRAGRPYSQPLEYAIAMIVSKARLDEPAKYPIDDATIQLVRSQLVSRIRKYEKRLCGMLWIEGLEPNVRQSVDAVGALLGLENDERLVLAFLVMLRANDELAGTTSILGHDLEDRQASLAIAAAIALPLQKVLEALSSSGRIMGSQMIRWEHRAHDLVNKFDWVSWEFPQEMLKPGFDPIRALRDRIVPGQAPTLNWNQFSHIGELHQVALSYVRQAVATGTKGVNILLHGTPGVGKTEFSRALAKELGCELYEVSTQDTEGDPIDGGNRLRALRLVHGFCSNRRAILVFDEIEDIFTKPHPFFGAPPTRCKGWVNRMLENNPSATIWITNSVEAIDPAFVRRFDLVLELKGPPAAERVEELRKLPVVLPDEAIRRLAASDELSPAVISRAAKVVSMVQSEIPKGRAPQVMELIVNQTLQAQGHGQMAITRPAEAAYDPSFINADFDPTALVEGIGRAKSARLCLFGPPGTGKTAFASWLAERLGLQVHMRRASDLMSPFVGSTEKNIARAFREAEDAGALLLIDEVDSFLQERSRAYRSWEVTQVNEFLTQMERFAGTFVATTNLIEDLDAASLRRFDLKGKFNFLRHDQARRLLDVHMAANGFAVATPSIYRQLESIDILTPGDFAAVARRHRFHPIESAAEWVAALEGECSRKPNYHRHVAGFGLVPNSV